MSLIHLEKSVLSFHLKEILEDGHGNHPLTWLGLGLLVVAPKLLPKMAKVSQPIPKTWVKQKGSVSISKPMSLSQWIAQAKTRELDPQRVAIIESDANGIVESDHPESVSLYHRSHDTQSSNI